MSPEKPLKLPRDTYITHMGHHHPEHELDNHFFDQLDIGSDAEWVYDRTGIERRRSVLAREDILALRRGEVTQTALRAAGKYETIARIAKSAWESLQPEWSADLELDAIVCGTSVPDYDIPANAATIASAIGSECRVWDLNSACSSFVVNLHANRALVGTGLHDNIAIFIPERYSMSCDYTDRRTAVLFGDACAVSVLSAVKTGPAFRVVDTIISSAPSKHSLVQVPYGGCFYQNGQAVQRFAVSKTLEATREILVRNNLTVNDISYFIGHQANLRMLVSAVNKLGLPVARHLYNVDQCGNQGAAGAPAVLSSNWSRFRGGDVVVVTVVGSGLTWGAALLEFEA